MYIMYCLCMITEKFSQMVTHVEDIRALCMSHTHTQGFVPAGNDVFSSETIIPAAYAAIDDVNGNCSILPDYFLQLEFVNTKVHAVHACMCTHVYHTNMFIFLHSPTHPHTRTV